MDSSFREHGSSTPRHPQSFLVILTILARLIQWLAGFISLTAEEQEEAGIYLDRLGGE